MKLMIDGTWRGDVAQVSAEVDAESVIHAGLFRDRIEAGTDGDAPEPGRYHLYISFACPFAHRTILARALLGLEHTIGMSVLHPRWNTGDGWVFGETPFSTPDLAGNRFTHLHQAYAASDASYTGKVTVPVLWDRKARRIVSNESVEIVEMLSDAFRGRWRKLDLFPLRLRDAIATLNRRIAEDLAGGVYARWRPAISSSPVHRPASGRWSQATAWSAPSLVSARFPSPSANGVRDDHAAHRPLVLFTDHRSPAAQATG